MNEQEKERKRAEHEAYEDEFRVWYAQQQERNKTLEKLGGIKHVPASNSPRPNPILRPPGEGKRLVLHCTANGTELRREEVRESPERRGGTRVSDPAQQRSRKSPR